MQPKHHEFNLSAGLLERMDAYWRAANYLSVGQIYLLDNPLLKEPLRPEHLKPNPVGHWGTVPGLNLITVHLNRLIRAYDLDMLLICGPGHGGPAMVANSWLDGTYSAYYPNISHDLEGMKALFRQFSFPGGIPGHAGPETPGSLHEGGELGYALSHAFGAVFDNPDLIACCIIGDGEAETGPLAAAWQSNKFLNPKRDGAVLPILHVNGYKTASPAVLARIDEEELVHYFTGLGYRPYWVEGSDPEIVHTRMASILDQCLDEIRTIQAQARIPREQPAARPVWPLVVLRTPKGWSGPTSADGNKTEGAGHAHPTRHNPVPATVLERWLKSYRPETLFDENGRPVPELLDLPPQGLRRLTDNPHTNGGILMRDLRLPEYQDHAVAVAYPGCINAEATGVLGQFLREVLKQNQEQANFRIFGSDETALNRRDGIFAATSRVWMETSLPEDTHLAQDGRIMEILSEHTCQGWLEGYLLTGRHGFFPCHEAFAPIVGSMLNQHAQWLKACNRITWRRPVASLNYLLISHLWHQGNNSFSYEDPGFIDHVINKKAEVVRVYLPPDANTLLAITDHVLRSRNYINVIVASEQPAPQWLTMDAAVKHCQAGIGVWEWACNDYGDEPDVVMACAGDVPTLETLAAIDILRSTLPDLKIRLVNVVNLMKLQPSSEHPNGLFDKDFDDLFTKNKPIVFAYHGYPWLIHRLTYRRTNHCNLHVRGYQEAGAVSTAFDRAVMNGIDRYHLVADVIDRVPRLRNQAVYLKQHIRDKLIDHKQYIYKHGEDMPEIKNWQWPIVRDASEN